MTDEPKTPEEQPNLEQPSEYTHICPECHTGVYRLEYLTYFTWLNDELITVPNFPSWVCDVCGKREYDPRAVSWLNMVLSPTTGRKGKPRHKHQTGNLNRPQAHS